MVNNLLTLAFVAIRERVHSMMKKKTFHTIVRCLMNHRVGIIFASLVINIFIS
jgi:hypothetical protein